MEKKLKNDACMLHGTPYCALLNRKNCESCNILKLSSENQLKAAEDILYIAEALPEGGVESMTSSVHCALCRPKSDGSEANAADGGYALLDLGHLHPTAKVGEKLGAHYDRGTAMTVPIQLPVCRSCRRKISAIRHVPLALGCISAALGLVITSLEAVRVPLTKHGRILPLLVFLIFVFLGVIIESLVRRALVKKSERLVNTRSTRIAALLPMLREGWFAIGEESERMPFVFIKKKLDSGILTSQQTDELLEQIRSMGKEGIAALKNRS